MASLNFLREKRVASLACSLRGLLQNKPTVRLYHLETMVYLQDVNVSSVIHTLIKGQFYCAYRHE